MKKYEVYKADDQDITYTRNFYQGENYSLSLLKSKAPASKRLFEDQALIKINNNDL